MENAMSKHAGLAMRAASDADILIRRSSIGTVGARALGRRVSPSAAAAVVERVLATDSATHAPQSIPVRGYTRLESVPRRKRKLTKYDLAPLVSEAGNGNPGAVAELLHMIGPVVVRYCRARMGGRDLSYFSADDVAQDVCLAVLRALPDHQDKGGSFLYLVHAIAAKKVAEAQGTGCDDDVASVLPERPLAESGPDGHAIHLDLGARLGKLVATLPRMQQEILALRIAVGLSASETAEALGISAGNVRVTQHRALTRLRGMVSEDDKL
jgi:RNA polymerase sigma-70 factor (ECF subfamily)